MFGPNAWTDKQVHIKILGNRTNLMMGFYAKLMCQMVGLLGNLLISVLEPPANISLQLAKES